jgi:hypothetical protein
MANYGDVYFLAPPPSGEVGSKENDPVIFIFFLSSVQGQPNRVILDTGGFELNLPEICKKATLALIPGTPKNKSIRIGRRYLEDLNGNSIGSLIGIEATRGALRNWILEP